MGLEVVQLAFAHKQKLFLTPAPVWYIVASSERVVALGYALTLIVLQAAWILLHCITC